MRISIRLVSVFFVANLWACASGGPSGSEDDAGVVSDAGPAPIDAFVGEGFGEPCEFHTDCKDGLCYRPDPTDEMGTCTEECTGNCPDGFACKVVQISEGTDARICIPAKTTFCEACTTNSDCGDSGDFCIELTAGNFCTEDCSQDATVCPAGFTCRSVSGAGDTVVGMQCFPTNGICCIDGDGDMRGEGSGCVTTDCDDNNDAVYDDAVEICDGYDQDCVGGVDVDVTDCAAAECRLGTLGFFERATEPCETGSCTSQNAVLCNLYTCVDGGENGDTCATACDVEDDAKCIPAAHCDTSVCYDDFANGLASDENSDCKSDHSQNGFCCDFGDCCQTASDCPTFGTVAPICNNVPTCQGTRGEAVCTGGFQCASTGTVEDDSACGVTDLAQNCGFYRDIFCDGTAAQTAPVCPSTCASDTDCDANAYCNGASQCVPDEGNGGVCDDSDNKGANECVNNYCNNGFCCDGPNGDCCASETDCPASYSGPTVCTVQSACQGEKDVAQCNSNKCTTNAGVDDDSACGIGLEADNCGPYKSIYCDGNSVQPPPACPTSCSSDTDCDANAYCNAATSTCVLDQPDGGVCNNSDSLGNAECQAGHCQNGFCCASGDCCAASTDCGAYDVAPACDSAASCSGTRTDGVCSTSSQCTAAVVNDDSGCIGLESNTCTTYPSVFCTAVVNQTAPTCASSCVVDTDCDASAHCDANVCIPDLGPGGFCDEPSDCTGGLTCVDSVCCNSACNGTCEACDLPGLAGTCSAVPNNQDPDNECNGFSCAGYYHSWLGDSCRSRNDAADNDVSCSGARACQTASDVCPGQPPGLVDVTCDDNCQNPNSGTCSGTSAGTCANVNPGTQTCGKGVCEVTVPVCQNGKDNLCVPNSGAATTETCNNIDDNCDGPIDNGSFSDGYEPNNTTTSYTSLPAVGSNNVWVTKYPTLYGAGDSDYFRITGNETDSSCQQCGGIFSADEDFKLTTCLTVPSGAGSYQFCIGNSATTATNCTPVLAGSSTCWTTTMDGGCCPGGCNDNVTRYYRIYGGNAPGYECSAYTLKYKYETGCFGI